jgi:hypothetical protein
MFVVVVTLVLLKNCWRRKINLYIYKNSAIVLSMKATILPNEISVEHTAREGREYLRFSISGWDEVSKLTKKVLLFNGNKFKFSCWNSDDLYCVFIRTNETATISK